MDKQNLPCKGEKRYWTNGCWSKDFGQSVKDSQNRDDIYIVHDGWNPENGATKVVRWRTIRD